MSWRHSDYASVSNYFELFNFFHYKFIFHYKNINAYENDNGCVLKMTMQVTLKLLLFYGFMNCIICKFACEFLYVKIFCCYETLYVLSEIIKKS